MPEKFSSPNSIKTTFEMDGLFTQEDIDNRYYIMGQCYDCGEWSEWDTHVGKWLCLKCGGYKYNMRESRSIRSWMTTKDQKTRRNKKDLRD